jgi:hypothetical protein
MSNRKEFFGVERTGLVTGASATAVFITAQIRVSTDRNAQSIKRIVLHSISGSNAGTASTIYLTVAGTQIHPTIHIAASETVKITDFGDSEFTGDINMLASGSSGVLRAEYSLL